MTAGLVGGLAALTLVMAMLYSSPRRFPLHPLYLIGSMFTIETTAALLSGLTTILVIAGLYGLVIAALFNGFDASGLLPLWGAVAGAALSIVTGTSLAYMRVISPAVRKGQVGDPGPFLARYGSWSVTQVIVAHALFGMVAGFIYAVIV